MPKVILQKDASKGKTIQINNVSIRIEYYQDDPLCRFLVYGGLELRNNRKVYIIELRKDKSGTPTYPGIDALRNFKKEVMGAQLYLNSDIPSDWKLNFPSHMPTYITGHLGRSVVINSENTLAILGNVGINSILNAPQKFILGVIEKETIATLPTNLPPVRAAAAAAAVFATVPAPALSAAVTKSPVASSAAAAASSTPASDVTIANKRQKLDPTSTALAKSNADGSTNFSSVRSHDESLNVTSPKLSDSHKRKITDVQLNPVQNPNLNVDSVSKLNTELNNPAVTPLNLLADPAKVSPSPKTPDPFRSLFLPKEPKPLSKPNTPTTPRPNIFQKDGVSASSLNKNHTLKLKFEQFSPTASIKSAKAANPSYVIPKTPSKKSPKAATAKVTVAQKKSNRIKNNIPNVEQRKIGDQRFIDWIALQDKKNEIEQKERRDEAMVDDLEEGEIIDREAMVSGEVESHQLMGFKEYLAGRLNGAYDTVLEWATGAGKTYFFSKLPHITGEKVFIGVPLITLEDQAASSVEKFCPTLSVGKLRDCTTNSAKGIRKFFEKYDVVIGTYQKLRLNKAYECLPFDIISIFIFDEAHNGLTEKTENLIKFAKSKGTSIIAATATPRIGKKKDGRDNVYHFLGFNDPILKENSTHRKINPVTPFTIREAIDTGVCAPVVTALVVTKGAEHVHFMHRTKKGEVKKQTDAGKVSESDAARTIDRAEFNDTVVDLFMNGRDTYFVGEGSEKRSVLGSYFRGEQGMVYCAGIVHSNHMAEAFNQVPISTFDKDGHLQREYENNIYLDKVAICQKSYERKKKENPSATILPFTLTSEQETKLRQSAHLEATTGKTKFCIAKPIHSKLSKDDRQAGIKQFKLGGIRIVTGDAMLTEGLDHPPASLVFITTNIHSERSLLQKAGRGGRKIRNLSLPSEKGKIWRVFNIVWPTLEKGKYFYTYLSENGMLEPKFTRGNDKINAIRNAYLASINNNSPASAAGAGAGSAGNNARGSEMQEKIMVAGTPDKQPQYTVYWEPNEEAKKLLEPKKKQIRISKVNKPVPIARAVTAPAASLNACGVGNAHFHSPLAVLPESMLGNGLLMRSQSNTSSSLINKDEMWLLDPLSFQRIEDQLTASAITTVVTPRPAAAAAAAASRPAAAAAAAAIDDKSETELRSCTELARQYDEPDKDSCDDECGYNNFYSTLSSHDSDTDEEDNDLNPAPITFAYAAQSAAEDALTSLNRQARNPTPS